MPMNACVCSRTCTNSASSIASPTQEFSKVAASTVAAASSLAISEGTLAGLVAKEMLGLNKRTGRKQSTDLTTWSIGNNRHEKYNRQM